jgi:hypothetical protein
MALKELTGSRDLTFSTWHRSLRHDCSWIDIDCCHYCYYCNSLLALFELVRSRDEFSLEEACRRKVAAITERVGSALDVPVFKVAYTGDPLKHAAVMQVGKPEITVMQPEKLAQFINDLHDCEFCRQHGQGRFGSHGSN